MLTADTITDDMIRELLDEADRPAGRGLSLKDRAWCIAALRIPVGKLAKVKRSEARARCAEILNTRVKDIK